ncbi:MAG: histidinol-phosphate aminotransferase family protein, partial [Streptosporangiaceae bacterium]|nr:histidinol-phosphate aminotransferase family protein [Streptosporangiaceae bacterium]
MYRLAKIAEERLLGVPGYSPGKPGPGPAAGKLSSNEAPLGPPPAVRAALAAEAGQGGRYPDETRALAAVAAEAGADPSQLLLTNGSDELCYLIATVFLGPGRVAVVGDPCYQIDATASLLAGATLRRVPLRDGRHDIGAMAEAAAGAAVVWLPSPHNPTGVAARPGDVAALLSRVPADCLVVLDEAYRAFLDPAWRPDVAALLADHPNLIVQRTLSKDWALAGLRAGYGLGPAGLMTALARVRPPFSVNAMALTAIEAAAGAPAWRAMAVARILEERALLEAELARLGVAHFPSQANFVTARLDPHLVAPALAGCGLVVRSGDDLGLPGWVRISVGWAPQMAQLRGVLRT